MLIGYHLLDTRPDECPTVTTKRIDHGLLGIKLRHPTPTPLLCYRLREVKVSKIKRF